MAKERVLVAMSGGVDSSVVAALMVREGFEAIGVTLQLRSCDERMASKSCCSADGIAQARALAGQLGMRHYVLDCRETFLEKVMRPAWEDYAQGRTPSPCLNCNKEIKFGLLGDYARRLGATSIATGHYARLLQEAEGPVLLRGVDPGKDQSYFLAHLDVEQLKRLRLPLGGLTKPQVRELARELGLATAERHESQDACMVLEGESFPESLRQRFGQESRPGNFVDMQGRVLGPHEGFHRYTIGQRRGLGIALGARARVVALREEDAAVVLSVDPADLKSQTLRATGVHWIAPPPERALVQIRSRHKAAPAALEEMGGGEWRVRFEAPQDAVAPGQALAFYEGERVLGGGWIREGLRDAGVDEGPRSR